MKKIILLMLCLSMLFSAALAEDPDTEMDELLEEYVLEDETGSGSDEELWIFPVALEDMKPEYVILANNQYLLDKKFVAGKLVDMKQRKADKNDNNTNGGVLRVTSGLQLEQTCAKALVDMSEAARKDGYKLFLKSAYRSYSKQDYMYKKRLKANKGKDDKWVIRAGASDHQTGLGCDVVPQKWREKAMNEKMAVEPECIWMAEHCQEFGFILRYPKDKQDLTEVNYEPWHMRYVGIPAATYIMENGLCLEEFNAELQEAIRVYLERGGDRKNVEAFIRVPNAK